MIERQRRIWQRRQSNARERQADAAERHSCRQPEKSQAGAHTDKHDKRNLNSLTTSLMRGPTSLLAHTLTVLVT